VNTVATTLLGRWASGRWLYHNPDYVYPDGGILDGYTRKQLRELTEHQQTYWLYRDVQERIVAVTSEGSDRYAELVFWVLIGGETAKLSHVTVMPEGWSPIPERL
jgi:hypothetical protein